MCLCHGDFLRQFLGVDWLEEFGGKFSWDQPPSFNPVSTGLGEKQCGSFLACLMICRQSKAEHMKFEPWLIYLSMGGCSESQRLPKIKVSCTDLWEEYVNMLCCCLSLNKISPKLTL